MKIRAGLNVNDTGFLFDPSTGESYSLNSIGAIYFKLISEGNSKEGIMNIVLEEYDVDRTTFEKSYIDFESRLKFLRLIEND